MMTAQEREQVRLSLLRYAQGRFSLALATQYLASEGQAATRAEVQAEADYLADKGLVVLLPKVISPEVALYRITAAGRDYLATQGMG